MALPDVTIEVEDGGLGIIPVTPSKASIKMGVCSGGTPNQLVAFGSVAAMQASLGQGKVIEAAAETLDVAGAPILVLPLNPSVQGSVHTATHVGTGLGTVVPSIGPEFAIAVAFTFAGALGAAKFTYQVGSQPTSLPILVPPDDGGGTSSFLVPGTLTHLVFNPNAGTFHVGDTFSVDVFGAVTAGGGNTGAGTVTFPSSPLDDYQIIVTPVVAGAIGVGQFEYSLDAGRTFSPPTLIPGGGGKYAIPNSGVVLTFANGGGAFVVGDTYTFDAATATFQTSDVTAAFASLTGAKATFGFFHLVGTPASASAAATLASVVDTGLSLLFSSFLFCFAFVECPTVGSVVVSGGVPIDDTADTDSVVAAAFTSFVSVRVSICAGDYQHPSVLTGRINRRNAAWAISTRAAKVAISRDLAAVEDGALDHVLAIFRDEGQTPALDAARISSLRTYASEDGFFITNARLMAGPTSDFQLLQFRRVMDETCRVARAALLKYLSGNVRTKDDGSGQILEQDAQAIERDVNGKLNDAIVAAGQATAAFVRLSRTQNIQTTETEPVEISVRPFGYLKFITAKIGFVA